MSDFSRNPSDYGFSRRVEDYPMKKQLSPHQRTLLRRIEKNARSAAILRLRGNVKRAMVFERKVDGLSAEAERNKLSGAAFRHEVKGQQAAGRLYHKAFGYKRTLKAIPRNTKAIIKALRARAGTWPRRKGLPKASATSRILRGSPT